LLEKTDEQMSMMDDMVKMHQAQEAQETQARQRQGRPSLSGEDAAAAVGPPETPDRKPDKGAGYIPLPGEVIAEEGEGDAFGAGPASMEEQLQPSLDAAALAEGEAGEEDAAGSRACVPPPSPFPAGSPPGSVCRNDSFPDIASPCCS